MTLLAAFQLLLVPLHAARTTSCVGTPDRRPQPRGARGPDRLLRQHPGPAHRPVRRPVLPRAAAPGARDGPRRLRPPGRAVRAARRGAQPERDLSRSPLFQVMFALQNAPQAAADAGGLAAGARASCEHGTAKFDLHARPPSETPDGLLGALEYNTDLFDAAPSARMLEHFATLLAARRRASPRRASPTLPLLVRRRAPAAARGLEPDATGVPARRLPSTSSSRPRPRAHAGRGRAGVRGRDAHLRAARRARPTSSPGTCASLGVGPESRRRPLPGALRRADRRDARHPQGRRRLPPARPVYPPERLAFMLRGRAAPPCSLTQRAPAAAASCPRASASSASTLETSPSRSPRDAALAEAAAARQPRLRHLHLRLHRPAQGRRRPAPRRRPPASATPTTSALTRRRPRLLSSPPPPSTPPPSRSGAPCSTARSLSCFAPRRSLSPPELAAQLRGSRRHHPLPHRRPSSTSGRAGSPRRFCRRLASCSSAASVVDPGAVRRVLAARRSRAPAQRLRPHREHHLRHLAPRAPEPAAARRRSHRPPARQHPRLRARRAPPARPRRRRRASCTSAATASPAATCTAGAHRRALRPRPLRRRARRAPLPHRRPRPLAARTARSSSSAAPTTR